MVRLNSEKNFFLSAILIAFIPWTKFEVNHFVESIKYFFVQYILFNFNLILNEILIHF